MWCSSTALISRANASARHAPSRHAAPTRPPLSTQLGPGAVAIVAVGVFSSATTSCANATRTRPSCPCAQTRPDLHEPTLRIRPHVLPGLRSTAGRALRPRHAATYLRGRPRPSSPAQLGPGAVEIVARYDLLPSAKISRANRPYAHTHTDTPRSLTSPPAESAHTSTLASAPPPAAPCGPDVPPLTWPAAPLTASAAGA
jgi:hypothetical protein